MGPTKEGGLYSPIHNVHSHSNVPDSTPSLVGAVPHVGHARTFSKGRKDDDDDDGMSLLDRHPTVPNLGLNSSYYDRRIM